MIRNLAAVILIVLGSIFLLNNLGIAKLPIREIAAKWWPAILIIIGISWLTRHKNK